MSVMLWKGCMSCIWLDSIVCMRWFRFRTGIEVIPLGQVLLWLLDADDDLSDPKIKPWIHQGKITLKILWWYSFCFSLSLATIQCCSKETNHKRSLIWISSAIMILLFFVPSSFKSATKFLCAVQLMVCDYTWSISRLNVGMSLITYVSRTQYWTTAKLVE